MVRILTLRLRPGASAHLRRHAADRTRPALGGRRPAARRAAGTGARGRDGAVGAGSRRDRLARGVWQRRCAAGVGTVGAGTAGGERGAPVAARCDRELALPELRRLRV